MKTRPELSTAKLSRRARLQALLFSGAALATTILTLDGPRIPKLPPGEGE